MEQNENKQEEKKSTGYTFEYNTDKWYNKRNPNTFPYPILAIKSRAISFSLVIVLIYLAMGFIWNLWHPGWIIFLFIPIIHWFTGKKG